MTDSFNNNVTAPSVETPVTFLNACLFVLAILSAISLSDADPGEGPGGPGPPLFFDQNEARRAEKFFSPGEGPGGPGPPLFFDQNEARRAEKFFWETVSPPPLISGSG